MRHIYIFLALICANGAIAASFNCEADGLTDVEQMICQDEELSALDDALAIWVENEKRIIDVQPGGTSNPTYEQRQQFFKVQSREWLRHRDECGADRECLEHAYLMRLGQDNLFDVKIQMQEMEELREDEILESYIHVEEVELVWTSVLTGADHNQDDRAPYQVATQEIVIRIQGEFSQSYSEPNGRFPFDEIVEAYSNQFGYQFIGTREYMRGGDIYTFNLLYDGLELQSVRNIGGGAFYFNTDFADYEHKVLSVQKGYIAEDCGFDHLPVPIRVSDEARLVPGFEKIDVFEIEGRDINERDDWSNAQIYELIMTDFVAGQDAALERMEALAQTGFEPAVDAWNCMVNSEFYKSKFEN